MVYRFLIFASLMIITTPVWAGIDSPNAKLQDATLEQTAQDMFENIRCPVCEGQSLNSSNADLAKTMRLIIREKLKSGETEQEILAFLKTRYGDEIDVTPQFSKTMALLWLLPLAIFLLGAGFFSGYFIHRTRYRNKVDNK